MKTEYVGLFVGAWMAAAAYLTGVLGPFRSLFVGLAVYVTIVIMNLLLEEYVKREIEALAGMEDGDE